MLLLLLSAGLANASDRFVLISAVTGGVGLISAVTGVSRAQVTASKPYVVPQGRHGGLGTGIAGWCGVGGCLTPVAG